MLSDNVHRYGTLKGSTRFQKGTLLRIPTKSSKWQIQKLINQEEISEQLPAECICCHKKENENDPNDPPMLLCDGCDAGCHLPCSGLAAIPENEWFCPNCLDILRARREKYNGSGSLRAEPPSLPELKVPPAVAKLRDEAQVRLQVRLEQRRAAALELSGGRRRHAITKTRKAWSEDVCQCSRNSIGTCRLRPRTACQMPIRSGIAPSSSGPAQMACFPRGKQRHYEAAIPI